MHICISGATGFLGHALTVKLLASWHSITIITRSKTKWEKKFGDSVKYLNWEEISCDALAWVEVIINLAWAPIYTFPRNKKNKDTIYTSRITSTKTLVSQLPKSCHTFVSGSAIWYYPSHPEKIYTPTYTNTNPESFMENVCVDWEAQAQTAATDTRRVICLRTWLVLWKEKIWRILELQTTYLGWIILWSWMQWMPTITLDQRVEIVLLCIQDKSISGPINLVNENIRHKHYIQRLAKKLHRPVWLHIPEALLKAILWEFSTLMLWSQHVEAFQENSSKK